MSRFLRATLVLLLLASCGGGRYSAPRNLDNACALIEERPQYFSAMKKTEAKWGIPIYVQMAAIHQESKFVGNAKTPHQYALGIIPMGRQSSAYGYSQALDGTWDDYREDQHRRGAKRDNISDATDFMGWYMTGTYARLGIPIDDVRNQYLAYHEGRSGYARGSYRDKAWLMDVADKVQARSDMYQAQLASCR